jgi:hypothetical protein
MSWKKGLKVLGEKRRGSIQNRIATTLQHGRI